ncbi:Fur family transcriptional regulator [Ornithinibacillus sp. 4-3]|uniref:Fur family transcriptional regulator n=1 Tax=Ornithinibacillus sp. 4-3 TaxID=3231488 RepID=A0AB39HNG3_9BACI
MDVKQAMDILVRKGYKVTKRREDIVHYFYEADGYRTAKDLNEYMEARYKGISFDTVYRNLRLYHDLGILESTELNAERHYRIRCDHAHHHHHFICNECGKTKAISVCPMDKVESMLTDYEIEGHKFEIYGLCPTCQKTYAK